MKVIISTKKGTWRPGWRVVGFHMLQQPAKKINDIVNNDILDYMKYFQIEPYNIFYHAKNIT